MKLCYLSCKAPCGAVSFHQLEGCAVDCITQPGDPLHAANPRVSVACMSAWRWRDLCCAVLWWLQALLLYLQASELGMEVAQSNAAWMLQRGFGHSGPLAAAVATAMYRRSAEQGNVMSLLQLGDCYYYGAGVEQDWVRASAIFYEAYKLGSPEAMFNLGFMHEYGAGVPKDMSLALRFYNMAKHTNADAALPVYLARLWLKLHGAWEWLRPSLPRPVVLALNWLFELRPAPSGAGALWASTVSSGDLQQLAAPAGPGQLPSAESATAGDGGQQQGQRGGQQDDAGASWLPLSPALLMWQWDAVMWKLTEAAGLAGLSINSFMQEYSDFGETVLLVVLLAVLLLVLHIRRQRQQALQTRLMAALAQPDQAQQLMAQQIAAQLGLDIQAPTGGPSQAAAAQPAPAAQGVPSIAATASAAAGGASTGQSAGNGAAANGEQAASSSQAAPGAGQTGQGDRPADGEAS